MYEPSFEFVPPAVWRKLDYLVQKFDLNYVFNHRAMRVRDGLHSKDYYAAECEGYYGAFERRVLVNGVEWFVGCNYE
jgi:hypothetical protein